MNKRLPFVLAFFILSIYVHAQSSIRLTLKEAIHIASENSLDYKIAVNRARSSIGIMKVLKREVIYKVVNIV
jgi:hypothetical protein